VKRTLANEPIPSEGRLLRQVSVRRLNAAIARKVAEIAREVSQPLPSTGAAAGGDPRKMAGVPIFAHGVSTSRFQPEVELLRKERREKYPNG
jgi:hypothetical protein